METKTNKTLLNQVQLWALIILRIIIGWYFLYEGTVKLMDPDWSAEGILMSSRFLSGIFQWLAYQDTALAVVNFLNTWGLILIGLGMFLGICGRIAVYAGILILLLYFVAFLPLDKFTYGIPTEGSYLLFDKTFIIMITLIVLALFPRTLNIGLLSLLKKLQILKTKEQTETYYAAHEKLNSRREMLKHLAFVPFLGGFIGAFIGNKKFSNLTAEDAITGGTIVLNKLPISKIEGKMPYGKLGNKQMSRLISGSNLIGGWSHARDLRYASQLFKAYNTEKKVFETLLLSEKVGINTINLITNQLPIIDRYNSLFNGKIQTMVSVGVGCGYTANDICEDIDRAIDLGADFIQIWGIAADVLARDDKIDELGKCVDYAKKQGYPTGIGAHDIHTLLACDKAEIEPDFYFKTMHHDQYWTATPKEHRIPYGVVEETVTDFRYDNMWCYYPEETVKFVQKTNKPVVGYKVLAAGAIPPEEGFQYAFDNGADFICVGMFDFQIVEDANIAIRSFEKAGSRQRPWYG